MWGYETSFLADKHLIIASRRGRSEFRERTCTRFLIDRLGSFSPDFFLCFCLLSLTFWWTLSPTFLCVRAEKTVYFVEKKKNKTISFRLSSGLYSFLTVWASQAELTSPHRWIVDRWTSNLWSSPLPIPLSSSLISPLISFSLSLLLHQFISSHFPLTSSSHCSQSRSEKSAWKWDDARKASAFARADGHPKQRFLYFIMKSRHLFFSGWREQREVKAPQEWWQRVNWHRYTSYIPLSQ